MITDPLCSFPACKLAKEKGFDEPCMHRFEWYEYNNTIYGPLALETPLMDFRKWEIPLEETRKRPQLFNLAFWPKKNSELTPWLYARPTLSLLETWLRMVHGVVIAVIPTAGNADHPVLWISYVGLSHQHWGKYKSYPEAKEAALIFALQQLKKVPPDIQNTDPDE